MNKASWKVRLALGVPLLFLTAWFFLGAATYVIQTSGNNNQVMTVTTSSAVTITLAGADYTLVHLNIQDDGTTASVATDYIVMMNKADSTGAAVTMAANYNDGGNGKMIVGAGAAATFSGQLVPTGPDGPCEIQIQAVGHGCKMELIRGHAASPP